MFPLRFHRQAVSKPWAGDRLRKLFPEQAADVPAGTGEWIELDGNSVIANGEWRERSLGQLAFAERVALLGELASSALKDFPLCIKFIDTAEPLSIQNHPADERGGPTGLLTSKLEGTGAHVSKAIDRVAAEFQARVDLVAEIARSLGIGGEELSEAEVFMLRAMVREQMEAPKRGRLVKRGKSECWLVLDAASDAVIYQGLREGISAAEFEAALSDGHPPVLLNARRVKPGDFLYNEAGMIHAIGGGIALLEIQQNCPVTYRLWDFPRAEKREMHVKQGLAAARFDLPLPPILPTHGADVTLAPQGPFGVRSLRVNTAFHERKHWPGFTVHTCLQGQCEISGRARDNLQPAILVAGDTLLWPAQFDEFEIYPHDECWLIQSWARE